MSNVEDVGARLVLQDSAAFRRDLQLAADAVKTLNDELARSAELAGATSKTITDSAAKTASAVKASSAVEADATKAAADAAEANAARVEAAQAKYAAAQAKVDKLAAAGVSANLKRAQEASTKILKYTSLGIAAIGYEGVRQFMSFQQMMQQGAIDAGLKASQIPALSKAALHISNLTGVAVSGTNGIADAMYRLASSYPGLHLTNRELSSMATNAAQLAVLAGQTGEMDSIGRLYGAVVSNGLSLNGGRALKFSTADGKAINEWVLSTVGHGDMKTGDLVSAMGTGLLPVAKTFGMNLNEIGAALDVLSPAMNASAASTRLKTALSMLAAPSQKASEGFELFGGNIATAGSTLRSKGLGGLLNYMSGMFAKPVTGSSFYSAFYGGGLGTYSGGSKGKPTGAIAYMRAIGLTPAQIGVLISSGATGFEHMSPSQLTAAGFAPGTSGTAATQTIESALLSGMFGGGHTGAAIMQLINERSTYGAKASSLAAGENGTAYQRALKLAYAEPMRQWDIFLNDLKNFTIVIGSEVTPPFEHFLHDLEQMGKWFSNNRWALDALGGAAAAVVGGAAAIKVAQMGSTVIRGGTSIVKVLANPFSSVKSLFTGSSTEMTAAQTQLRAAEIQLEAANHLSRFSGNTPTTSATSSGGEKKPTVGLPGEEPATTPDYLFGKPSLGDALAVGTLAYSALGGVASFNNVAFPKIQQRVGESAIRNLLLKGTSTSDHGAAIFHGMGGSGKPPAWFEMELQLVEKEMSAAQESTDAARAHKEAAADLMAAAQHLASVGSPTAIAEAARTVQRARIARK